MSPFVVYVYPNNRDSIMLIGRIITKAGISDILEIKKIGREKILVVVKTASVANRLVEITIFPKYNIISVFHLCIFIPAFMVLRTDVIQDVPQQIDLETLKGRLNLKLKFSMFRGSIVEV